MLKSKWEHGGGALLIVISSIVVWSGYPKLWSPMPVPLVIVGWVMPPLSLLVTPALYLLLTRLLWGHERFPKIVLALILVFGFLNFLWIWVAWEHGLKYQGNLHTTVIAIENFLSFTFVLVLSLLSLRHKSLFLAQAANLVLFVVLSWCAFPYLGEMM